MNLIEVSQMDKPHGLVEYVKKCSSGSTNQEVIGVPIKRREELLFREEQGHLLQEKQEIQFLSIYIRILVL